jgi:MoaA/NifB/PqqE/SkfB family radical SAM enzyme
MPCTTTDESESHGHVRETPLSDIWAAGFSAFRTPGDDLRFDCSDCWLQTRHGHSCRSAFFIDLLDDLPVPGVARPMLQIGLPERREVAV